MPNKTIYVSDDDLPVLTRAQEISGGNLSGAIIDALRSYVSAADYRDAGYAEVVLRSGPDGITRKRFFGRLLVADTVWDEDGTVIREYRVYEGRTGRLVLGVHTVDWSTFTGTKRTGNWFKDMTGFAHVREMFAPSHVPDWGEYEVHTLDGIDDLAGRVPESIATRAAAALAPPVEDLDV